MYPIGDLSIIGFIVSNSSTIIITLSVGVLSVLIAEVLLAYWKKPKFVIECSNVKPGKLGFSVYVRKKELEKATVKCNNIKYEWEKQDGTKSENVDLCIGGEPETFYPFDVSAVFVEELPKYERWLGAESDLPFEPIEYAGGVRLTVTETATQKIMHSLFYAIPVKSKWLVWFAPWDIKDVFTARIRIIAKGNEEESDYILRIGLRNLIIHPIIDNKPLMKYVDWAFEVKTNKKYFYHKRGGSLID
jgi:hypothetical protein